MSGLLNYDDFEGWVVEDKDGKVYRWRERVVRELIAYSPNATDQTAVEVLHEDTLRTSPIGLPAQCLNCNTNVAVWYGTRYLEPFYPFGFEKYGTYKTVQLGQYCPHCDGGEDIG